MQLPTCINGSTNNLEKKSSGLTAEKRCLSHLLATCFEIPQVHLPQLKEVVQLIGQGFFKGVTLPRLWEGRPLAGEGEPN